jgi:hypothetical protein
MLNDAKIQELKAAGAEVIIELGEHEFALRPPKYPEFLRFLDESQSEGVPRSEAVSNFVYPAIVWPEKAEARRLIEAQPAFLTKLSSELQALAGGKEKARAKKL